MKLMSIAMRSPIHSCPLRKKVFDESKPDIFSECSLPNNYKKAQQTQTLRFGSPRATYCAI